MKSILIICLTPVMYDPRLRRQVKWLSGSYDIGVLGFAEVEDRIPGARIFPAGITGNMIIRMAFMLLRYFHLYRIASIIYGLYFPGMKKIIGKSWDAVIVNDLQPLALGFSLAKGAPVHFDAHEYYLDAGENSFKRRAYGQGYLEWLARKFIPMVRSMTTVCDGIAQIYFERYNLRPEVILNAPDASGLGLVPVDENHIRIIHHGGCNANRRIDRMIEVMKHTDERFTLDLMLMRNQPGEYDRLKTLAAGMANVRFVDPVPMPEISAHINGNYDIGLYLLEPVNTNQAHALPNKLFEFIQANLAVVIGPAEEMGKIVNRWECGKVSENFDPVSMATLLNSLDAGQILRMKEKSREAASVLNSGNEGMKFCRIIDLLVNRI